PLVLVVGQEPAFADSACAIAPRPLSHCHAGTCFRAELLPLARCGERPAAFPADKPGPGLKAGSLFQIVEVLLGASLVAVDLPCPAGVGQRRVAPFANVIRKVVKLHRPPRTRWQSVPRPA